MAGARLVVTTRGSEGDGGHLDGLLANAKTGKAIRGFPARSVRIRSHATVRPDVGTIPTYAAKDISVRAYAGAVGSCMK